jgi:hypothetical protein
MDGPRQGLLGLAAGIGSVSGHACPEHRANARGVRGRSPHLADTPTRRSGVLFVLQAKFFLLTSLLVILKNRRIERGGIVGRASVLRPDRYPAVAYLVTSVFARPRVYKRCYCSPR